MNMERGHAGWKTEEVPTLALAFIGDAVWHLYVRDHVLSQGVRRPHDLHRAATRYARADAQARALLVLMAELTDEEAAVAKRGRNAKTNRMGKNVDMIDYRHSTGFESLLGHLYGRGEVERLRQLCLRALEIVDGESGDGDAEQS